MLENYYQLHASFETLDAMGANFINSCLEQFAQTFEEHAILFTGIDSVKLDIVMSILSNYVPNCLVRAEVSCLVSELNEDDKIQPKDFANKFIFPGHKTFSFPVLVSSM